MHACMHAYIIYNVCMHITKSGLSSWPLRLLTPSWRLLGVGSLHPQRPLPVWPRRQLLEQVVSLRPSRPSQWFHQRIPQRKLQRHQWLTWRNQGVIRRKSSRNPSQSRFPNPLFPLPPRNRLWSDIVARAQQHLHMQVRSPKLSSSRR